MGSDWPGRYFSRALLRPAALVFGASAAVWPIVFYTGVYKFARQTMTTVVKCKFFNPPLFTYQELINNGAKAPSTIRRREGLPRPFSPGACGRGGGVEQIRRGT